MKKSLITLMMALVVIVLHAVPAKPGRVKVKIADGSKVEASIIGDEYWHIVADEEGKILTEREDGLYERSNVSLSSIDVKRQMRIARQGKTVIRKPMGASAFVRGIVILVSFSDKAFTKSRASFDNMLNKDSQNRNTATGSARDYFANSSFGAFVPHFDVYGPYTLPKNCSYYGGNSGGIDIHAGQMVVDAVAEYINENGENALQQYDCDGDGYVDNVFIFYAGHGENAGGGANCIWPHRSYVYPGWVSGRTTYGGVQLGEYACTCELQGASGSTMSGIGPFCHEFSHVLGLPDLYDTEYSGHKTCSTWDVMDAGNYLNSEHTPPAYSSYERFYLGWLTPEILSEPDNVTLEGLNASNQAKIITATERHNLDGGNPNPDEFFLLEVRNGIGWDKYLPGRGVLITKVKYDYYTWLSNEVNNDASDMGVDIIEAGGSTAYLAQSSDPFPGTDHVNSYTPYSGQELTEIVYISDNATFKYKGGRTIFKVRFDGMEHAVPLEEELMETSEGSGVILPDVLVLDEDYTFEGWSISASASTVSAGDAGEIFYPEDDTRLFAVFKHNGILEPTERGCETETFNNCKGQYTISNFDKYTDMQGWYGEVASTSNGAIKTGNNDNFGFLISPRLHVSGDVKVEVVCKALMNAQLIVTAANGNSDSVSIGTEYQTVTLNIGAVPMDSRLTFSSTAKIFFMDSVEFCGARKSPVENVEVSDYVLFRENGIITVAGLRGGERVRLVDMLGRVLCEKTAQEEQIRFETGVRMYMVQVFDREKVITLK